MRRQTIAAGKNIFPLTCLNRLTNLSEPTKRKSSQPLSSLFRRLVGVGGTVRPVPPLVSNPRRTRPRRNRQRARVFHSGESGRLAPFCSLVGSRVKLNLSPFRYVPIFVTKFNQTRRFQTTSQYSRACFNRGPGSHRKMAMMLTYRHPRKEFFKIPTQTIA
jgi:hypothetical protein